MNSSYRARFENYQTNETRQFALAVLRDISFLAFRRRNEDDDSPNKLYTLVSVVQVDTFKGLQNTTVE